MTWCVATTQVFPELATQVSNFSDFVVSLIDILVVEKSELGISLYDVIWCLKCEI